jgi:3-oxoadipate enol-lactonase
MPNLKINNCDIYYEIHGEGSETIVFSHGLLWSGKLFYKQVEYFKSTYKVVIYDHRGQGKSEVTTSGYEMDALSEDAAKLIETLKLGKVHFAGLSMGGFVAMRLAARRSDLIKSVILMETSAQPEPNKAKYAFLNTVVKFFGVNPVANAVMKIMFGDTFLNDSTRTSEKEEWKNELKKNKKSIVRTVNGVISRSGVEEELANIKCPTLVMVGNEDKATIPAKAAFIHENIPHSYLVYIDNAGHSCSIEEPKQVNTAIESFLISLKNA